MSSTVCYIPQKGIDDKIGEALGWNSHRVANLRGLYDTMHETKLDTSNLIQAANTLRDFRINELRKQHNKELNSANSNLASSYRQLTRDFSSQEKADRIDMICTYFSIRLDNLSRNNIAYDRQAICNGIKQGGKIIGGEFGIFEWIYDTIQEEWANAINEGYPEDAEKFQKVLENWPALVTYARQQLRDTEGLKLGGNIEYSDYANSDNFGDNDLANTYDASETRREGWQEIQERISQYGTLGAQTRRILGMLPLMEDGEVVTDDLGYTKHLNSVKAHQTLMEVLRNMENETQMRALLQKASQANPWMAQLLEVFDKDLNNHGNLQTQFFCDMCKNFQAYSTITEENTETTSGIKQFKTPILNRIQNRLYGSYIGRIFLGKPVNPETSVFDSKGNIDWDNIKTLKDNIKFYFGTPRGLAGQKLYNSPSRFFARDENKIDALTKRQVLNSIFEALGIDVDSSTIEKILYSQDIYKVANILEDLVDYGIDGKLASKMKNEATMSWRAALKLPSETAKNGVIREKMEKLFNIITANREGLRLESRVRHYDSKGNPVTLYSDVNPSYLGDMMGKIANFIKNNDKKDLKEWIEQTYFKSSYFKDSQGHILNKWLEDLYNGKMYFDINDTDSPTLWKRFLGTSDTSFENFTSKQHAIDMIAEFFAEQQQNSKSQYAWYPTFILGDSGVSKFIRAKRYGKIINSDSGKLKFDTQEILDGMYNVYRQECRKAHLQAATAQKLYQDGYAQVVLKDGKYILKHGIENYNDSVIIEKTDTSFVFKSNMKAFSSLPFLNSNFKFIDAQGTENTGKYAQMLSENPTEQEVKKAITQYMRDSFQVFTKNLNNLGLMETKEIYNSKTNKTESRYVYLDQIAKDGDITTPLEEYFWNTKFATIQQIQLMSVDPSFYKGVKDMQKRYKEIHAPGTRISTEARDYKGDLYSDGIERCIYFDDISLDGSIDKQFMTAMEKIFKDRPGGNEILKKYHDNTLTDGQGYRSLDSYRKVKGMQGQWTREMESVYKEIKSLQAKYGKDDNVSIEDQQRIADLAVVFQPIKPYMYTLERLPVNGTDIQLIPIQHKYAEVVLIPELLPAGSQLRDMAYYMQENNIDVVASTKCVKVGNFGAVTINNISDRDSLEKTLSKGYVHQLNYNDYRIQTNVPEHINSSQLFATQVRKLIMSGVKKNDYHYENYVGGHKVNLGTKSGMARLNGRNLVSFYNSLITANILQSFKEFSAEIEDPKHLSERLIQTILSNSRESLDSILAYSLTEDDNFLVPLFEGGLEHDSMALLASMFKKAVNKQTIKGGSAVQASAMGLKGYEKTGDLGYIYDKEGNPIQAEIEVPFDFTITNENGSETALKFEDWCNEDGTFKTDSKGETLIETTYPGILDLIAYRIPTERDYSMINCKIKRCSSKTAGGTIKVPFPETTKAGFDFDIDKLYFIRKEFKTKNLTQKQVEQIWKDAYEEQRKEAEVRGDEAFVDKLREFKDKDAAGKVLVNAIFSKLFANSELASEIVQANNDEEVKKLYQYWTEAGLPGTPTEFFENYLTRHAAKYGYNKFEEYDYNKTPLENTRVARNNMLFQLIQQRLQDPETLAARFTPGGFSNSSKAARVLRELLFGKLEGIFKNNKVDLEAVHKRANDKALDPEPQYDYSDPWTIVTYNQQNQVAGKLIGVFANQNTNHAFASLMSKFKLKRDIQFAGHSFNDLLHTGDQIEIDRIDLNMAEFLAASVDAVKDPVLNFLNLNTITADSGALLVRIGYTTEEVGMLFNQPIIKELCEMMLNEDIYFDEALRRLKDKYEIVEIDAANPNVDFSMETMATNIIRAREAEQHNQQIMNEDKDFAMNQMKVLELFNQIHTSAQDISRFITATKFTASNAVGSTAGDFYAQQMKVKNYLSKFEKNTKGETSLTVEIEVTDSINRPINDDYALLNMTPEEYMEAMETNPFAYEQAMYDMNRKFIRAIAQYYPYETPAYTNARNHLARLTREGVLDADTINTMHSDMLVYMLSKQENSLFNGDLPMPSGDMTIRDYYTKEFAKETYNRILSDPSLLELPIFKFMEFNVEEDSDGNITNITMNIQSVTGLDTQTKDMIKESWTELAKNPETSKLARDLFMYNFYKLGFTFSPIAFMNLAPTEVKAAIGVGYNEALGRDETYIEFLNRVLDGGVPVDGFDRKQFIQQFILNHLNNTKLVRNLGGEALQYAKKQAIINNIPQNSFTLDTHKLGDYTASFTINDPSIDKGQTAFAPVLNINGAVYMCDNGQVDFNIANGTSITYYRVGTIPSGKNTKVSKPTSINYSSNAVITNNSFGTQMSGNSTLQDNPVDPAPSFDREEIIAKIIKAGVVSGIIMQEEVDKYQKELIGESDAELLQDIEDIKAIAKENGVIDQIMGILTC